MSKSWKNKCKSWKQSRQGQPMLLLNGGTIHQDAACMVVFDMEWPICQRTAKILTGVKTSQCFLKFSHAMKWVLLSLKLFRCIARILWFGICSHINKDTWKGEMAKVAKTGMFFETSILFSEFWRWHDYRLCLSLSHTHTHTHTYTHFQKFKIMSISKQI